MSLSQFKTKKDDIEKQYIAMDEEDVTCSIFQ